MGKRRCGGLLGRKGGGAKLGWKGDWKGTGCYLNVPFGEPVDVRVVHGAERVFGDEVDDAGDALEAVFWDC